MSLEQRVERVEVQMDAHHQLLTDVHSGLRQFEVRVDARFAQVDARFTQFEARVDGRFLALDHKVDALRHEMALQFRWLVGLMLTGMATIAPAILSG